MRIIFAKSYTDKESFDNWFTVAKGEKGFLVDEVTGRIELEEGGVTLEGVPSSCYVPLREDVN